jgi:hypothetical protein
VRPVRSQVRNVTPTPGRDQAGEEHDVVKQNTASAQPGQRSHQNPRSDQCFGVRKRIALGREDVAVEQVEPAT